MLRISHAVSGARRYATTIGRLISAVSSVAVPDATSDRVGGRQRLLRTTVDDRDGHARGVLREAVLEQRPHRGVGHRRHETDVGTTFVQPRQRRGERAAEPGNLRTTAARKHRHRGRAGVETQGCARGTRRRFERNAIGKRVADEHRSHVVRVVEPAFERQHAEHEIDGLADGAHPALPPCPHLRTDVLHRRNTLRLELGRDAEIEFGRVDADEDVGSRGEQSRDEVAAQAQQARQVPHDLGETHDREFVGRYPGLTARLHHARSGHAECTQRRLPRVQCAQQSAAEVVARGLAGDERDIYRSRATGRGDDGTLAHAPQRTRLRVDCGMKSTSNCTSGWSLAASVRRSTASSSRRPERYSVR